MRILPIYIPLKIKKTSYVPKIENIKEKVIQEYSSVFLEEQLELLTKNTLTVGKI